MRPVRSTPVASTTIMPARVRASCIRCWRCQSVALPSAAEYWHMGDTTMRLGSVTGPSASGEKSWDTVLALRGEEVDGGGGGLVATQNRRCRLLTLLACMHQQHVSLQRTALAILTIVNLHLTMPSDDPKLSAQGAETVLPARRPEQAPVRHGRTHSHHSGCPGCSHHGRGDEQTKLSVARTEGRLEGLLGRHRAGPTGELCSDLRAVTPSTSILWI